MCAADPWDTEHSACVLMQLFAPARCHSAKRRGPSFPCVLCLWMASWWKEGVSFHVDPSAAWCSLTPAHMVEEGQVQGAGFCSPVTYKHGFGFWSLQIRAKQMEEELAKTFSSPLYLLVFVCLEKAESVSLKLLQQIRMIVGYLLVGKIMMS